MATMALVMGLFFIRPIPMDQNTTQGFVMVRGTVRDNWRNRNIPGAVVYATSETDVQVTISDARGFFYFLTLLPGNYSFYAEKSGYNSNCMWRDKPKELDAGFEYLATVTMFVACY